MSTLGGGRHALPKVTSSASEKTIGAGESPPSAVLTRLSLPQGDRRSGPRQRHRRRAVDPGPSRERVGQVQEGGAEPAPGRRGGRPLAARLPRAGPARGRRPAPRQGRQDAVADAGGGLGGQDEPWRAAGLARVQGHGPAAPGGQGPPPGRPRPHAHGRHPGWALLQQARPPPRRLGGLRGGLLHAPRGRTASRPRGELKG